MAKSKSSKSKPTQTGFRFVGPVAPDDPIYKSGYVMLRPIRTKKDRQNNKTKS